MFNLAGASVWFDENEGLKIIFHDRVWYYVEKAGYYDTRGNREVADSYLRLAKRKIEEAKPFDPGNWPEGWPDGPETLKMLKNASPEAYLYRIIGDYALAHERPKEALIYYDLYLKHSMIPDTGYMLKVAEIFEGEKRWLDAKIIYEEAYRAIEAKNFHGRKLSPALLRKRIKNAEIKLKRPSVLTLDMLFRNIQDFMKADVQKMFATEMAAMEGVQVIDRKVFDKTMNEQQLRVEDFKHSEELSRLGKMLNADYILRPVLTRIDNYYIFQVDVFDPMKAIWFENYEYKTESYRYIHNFIKRFAFQFQDEDIPGSLFIPENEFLWNYEADSLITDFSFSAESMNIIAGTDNGTVYVLNGKGEELRQFNMPEKIIKVAISPCGKYFAWISLNGRLYFADIQGVIRWTREVKNYARGIDIAGNGTFIAVSINDKVIFWDRNGDSFWEAEFPQWVSSVKISAGADQVFVGMDNGQYWSLSDEGNVLWKKNLNNRIAGIKVSANNYSCAVTEKGKTFLFDDKGSEIINFEAGQDTSYSAFNPEILKLMVGKKGNYFYMLSHDKQKLWMYNLSMKASFINTLDDGTFLTTVEGKNIFSFKIIWL